MNEYKGFEKEKWVNIDLNEGALFKWTVGLMVINPDSAFDGAYFKAEMTFTDKYPFAPPTFKFIRPIFHPNIYPDGKVCISILHAAGADEQAGELAEERWSPLQSVESILRSILLLLDDPYIGSPANVDAGVMYRDDREAYNHKARETVEVSKKDVPEGFTMPKTLANDAPPPKIADDDDFWNESGDEDDFGGASDSSGEDLEMDEDEDNPDYEEDGEEEDEEMDE